MAPAAKRVESNLCARCRKEFQAGDRVVMVFIVEKTGRPPKEDRPKAPPWERGAFLLSEFELAHVTCADPGLDGRLL